MEIDPEEAALSHCLEKHLTINEPQIQQILSLKPIFNFFSKLFKLRCHVDQDQDNRYHWAIPDTTACKAEKDPLASK